jgi:hypothetical protein
MAAVSLAKRLHTVERRRINQKTEMKPGHLMAEDSFEKARKAFFGMVTTTLKPSVSPAQFFKPRNEALQTHRPLAGQSLPSFAASWNRTSMRLSSSTALLVESGCALSLAGLTNSRHSLKDRVFNLDGFSFSTGL